MNIEPQALISRSTKTAIVTGGNTGLGYSCAQNIALDLDWHVVIASRNPQANEAAQRIIADTGNPAVEVLPLDLASLESVRAFVYSFEARHLPPVHAIVCNAGLQVVGATTYTQDGFETTFGVNHLGHFLLVNLLLRDLAAPAQIILLGSSTHDPAKKSGLPAPNFSSAEGLAHPQDTPQNTGKNWGWLGRRRYSTSKLCNILFAYELNRRLQSRNLDTASQPGEVAVNVFDPGLMPGSGLARDYSTIQRFVWNYIFPVLRLILPNVVSTTAKSGATLAKLATDAAYQNVTGKYLMFNGLKEERSSVESYDSQKAAQFWEDSAKLVSLAPGETILEPQKPFFAGGQPK